MSYSETTEGTICEQNNANGKSLRRSRRKKTKTRQKLKYVCSSSTDDNIPLSMYAQRQSNHVFDVSDNDKTYVPILKDLNSTDSEFSSNVSEKTRKDIAFMKTVKESFLQSKRRKSTLKQKHSTRKQRKQQLEEVAVQDSENNENLQKVKEISMVQTIVQNTIIKANEGRVDQVLNSHGLRRRKVSRHGNCFLMLFSSQEQ
jgi:hypothetical protein